MKTVYDKATVRFAHFRLGKSMRAIAKKIGINRRTVKKLLSKPADEIPKYTRERNKNRPVLGQFTAVIDHWLEDDKNAPRKQRHTIKRIHDRLKTEYGFTGGYTTVRDYVAQVREKPKEVFLTLTFEPGEMAQVDWGEDVEVILGGKRQLVQFFAIGLNYSNTHYIQAFENTRQEAFFEGHDEAFRFFGGVPGTLTYDNLTSAVTKVLKGKNRLENEGFVAFRSAWLFEARFCTHSSIHIRKP